MHNCIKSLVIKEKEILTVFLFLARDSTSAAVNLTYINYVGQGRHSGDASSKLLPNCSWKANILKSVG